MSSYVKVKEETEKRLHFVREPSMRAWAILVGLISLGAGAAYYSADYLLWKLAYISGAVFMGLTVMEDWEECILDKEEGKVTVKKMGLVQRFFQDPKHHQKVVAEMSEITSVSVEQENVKYSGTGYQVVLNFASGYSIGVTETATMGDNSEHEMVAAKIRSFINLDETKLLEQNFEAAETVENNTKEVLENENAEPVADVITASTLTEEDTAAKKSESESSSDEGFEKIEHTEVMLVREEAKDEESAGTENTEASN